MLKVTKLADYAVAVMQRLALAPDQLYSAAQLAAALQLGAPTVSKLLKLLLEADLLKSQQGIRGGYQLVRPAAEINLAEIIAAVEGPLALTECCVSESCKQHDVCSTKNSWNKANDIVANALRDVKLQSLLSH